MTVASARGLTASVTGTTVALYTTSNTALFSIVDATGYNAAPTASATTLATAATNTAFRGVAFAPAIAQPDLAVALSAPASATLNQPFNYSLVVSNPGSVSASGIAVNFSLPASTSVTFNSAVVASNFALNTPQSGTLVSFSSGTLAAGASTTLTVNVTPTVTGNITSGTAVVDPANAIAESNEANNSAPGVTVNASAAPAGIIRITEFAYSGTDPGGEFVEFTNVGNAPVDMTGWTFSDNARASSATVVTPLTAFGTVQPGESVILSESAEANFRTAWFLPTTVKVIGSNAVNLSRSDEINIYDASSNLIDRLTFNDQGTPPAGPRAQNASAWTTPTNLGSNTIANWQLSVAGDAQTSYLSATNNIGNPGGYNVPLPRVLVRESANNTTITEGGSNDSYTVALNVAPTADVTITITGPGVPVTVSPSPLVFTPANFATAQTVTVAATNDGIGQGNRTVTITQAATSSDAAYNGIAVNPVSVSVIDGPTANPISISAVNNGPYLSTPTAGPAFVSGVINDPTDPASTLGVNFSLSAATNVTVTAGSSNQAVVPDANIVLAGAGADRNLKITPAAVGFATVSVTATNGTASAIYVINYAASAGSTSASRFHTGASDASTAQAVGASYMLVGDDENQGLRLYNRLNSGLSVNTFDFTTSLGLTDIDGGIPREIDLEGSVQVGSRIYWIGSHSNKSDNGNNRPNRSRLFATDVTGSDAATTLTYVGRYDGLKADLVSWDQSNGHGLGANYLGLTASTAVGVPGEGIGGFNIEGLTTSPDNSAAYVAFRAPIEPASDRTKALIVPVTNFASLVTSNPTTGPATFGAPILLDLGGRGIREIKKNANNEYLIVAGSFGNFGAAPNDFRLYTWTGVPADAPVLRAADLSSLQGDASSIESIVELPTPLTPGSSIQFVLDNGDMVLYNDGTIAKDLAQNNWKKSRSDYATLGAALAPTLVANPTTLSNFTALTGAASDPQVYTLTGSNLTASASVSVSAGYEISTDGTTYSTSATVSQTTGALSQTIAVRLASSQTTGAISGTVTNVSGSATATVALSGSVTAPVVIPPFVGTLANYTFENVNTPTSTATNVTASNATFGSAVNSVQYFGGNPGQGYSGANWGTTALDANAYLEFSVTPATGFQVSVTSVVVDLRRSGTGPVTAELRSSADNFGAAIGSTNVVPTSFGTITFPVTPAQNSLGALTFRIYGYGSTGTGGTLRFDNLNLNGSVISSTTPFISATPSPVSLSYTVGTGPASQVVTVNAGNLTPTAGNVTISSSSTAVTAAPATLAYTGGALNGATFTAQLVANLPVGTYPATLTLTNGTTSTTLAVNGTVSNTVAVGAPTLISSIQGSGSTAALTGTRTIEGIVTRVFTGTAALNGFYVQEEDADSDNNPATSEAIAVFDLNGVFAASQGDKVRITGPVGEFTSASGGVNSSLTQMTLTAGTNLTIVSNNNPLPAVTTVTLPVANVSDLERYEGMLVTVQASTGNLVVTDNFTLGRFGQVTLAATDPATNQPGTDARIEQYTQFNLPSVAGNVAYQAAIAKRLIILDDASGVQNPPQIIHARGGQPLSGTNTLRAGDDVASLTGILDERFEGYRIQTNVGVNFNPANPRLNAPVAVGGTMKVMGLNVLNYFTDLDLGSSITIPNSNGVSFQPRGAETTEEFTRQRTKIIAAITSASPDILGVIEMENNGNVAIGNLVDGLNAVTAPGTYTYVNDANLVNDPNTAPGAVGTDAIKVGLIYKPASVSAVGLPMSSSNTVFDRPPVAQTFLEKSTGAKFSVIVNHFKSKGSGSGADADQNDGQGASNNRRVQQANALISFVPSVTAAAGDPDVLMLGDYNAYALEDPIRALSAAGLNSVRPNDDYSYAFGGQFGFLDYAFANASLAAQVTGSTDWHINSDEPIILDYNTNFKQNQPADLYAPNPFRASDHDAVVVGLSLTPSLSATLIASTSVCAGSPASLSLTVAGLATGATYSYTISNGTNSTTAAGVSASAIQTSVVPTIAGSFTATILTSTSASTTAASGNVAINALPTNASLTSGTLTCANTSVTLTASATGGTSYTLTGGPTSQTNTTGQFVVSTAGTYTAIIANASGCTATATATITSSTATPTNVSLTSGTLTCANTSVTLTASSTGGTSYTLSDGQSNTTGQFVVNIPGTYTVTASSPSGCTASATGSVISSTATPIASLSASSTTACSPASITLTAGGGMSYTFSAGATQIGQSNQAIVTQSGTYSVVVSNASGCTATASVSVTVNTPPAAPTLTGVSRVVNASTTPLPLSQFVQADNGNTLSFSGVSGLIANPPTANISQAGVQSFSVTQTSASGCVSPATPFTITVQQSVTTSPGSQTVCRSSAVVLNATTTGVRYEWYKNGTSAPFKLTEIASIQRGTATASLTVVSIQTSGSYYVKVFQADGSFSFDGPFVVTVNYGCVAPGARLSAAAEVEAPLSVVLTPNPVVDGQLRAVVRGAAGQALSVQLIDLRGTAVRVQTWAEAETEQVVDWNISQQASGLYLLKATVNGQISTLKVIKP